MLKAGVVSFYGPSIMTSFAENTGMHSYTVNALKRLLFRTEAPVKIMGNLEGWTSQRLEWLDPKNQLVQREMQPHLPWRWLQGSGVKSGVLIGGCLEVLDWLRGTSIWPDLTLWRDAILFIETSEDAPTPIQVKMFLRSLGALGILSVISGILFGRPGGEILSNKFAEYDRVLVDVIAGEMGLNHLPIISCMDFGHTDPVTILPYGINAKIDCNLKTIDLLEPAVVN